MTSECISPTEEKFWETKSLAALDAREWEALCDGCGRCCLHKLEDADSGELFLTNVACRLLNLDTGRCTHYRMRKRLVPDCVQLNSAQVGQFAWLPVTCAYRLLAEGKPLPRWHPLISGDRRSVQQAGISVRGWTVSEEEVDELEDHVIGD